MKLRWKIALPVLALLLLLITLVTIMNYAMTKASVEQIIGEAIDSNLDTLISQIDRATNTEKIVSDELSNKNVRFAHVLAEIVRLNAVNGTLNLDDVPFFERIAALLNVTEINVVDGVGDIVGSNLAENYGFNYSSADSTMKYMQILENPAIDIVEAPRASAVSGDMYQYMGTARTDAAGFVQVGFDANVVQEFQGHLDVIHTAADMHIGSTGRASIIRDGIVVYSRRAELIGRDVTGEDWYAQVSAERGKAWIDIYGDSMYAGYANTDDMTLLILFPRAEYNAHLNSATYTSIAGVAMAVLIAVVIYFLVAKTLSPLIPFAAFMKKAGSTGDLALSPEDVATIGKMANSKDELGECIGAAAAFVQFVTDVSGVLETVAGGDLTAEITPLSERDTLGISLGRMNERLNSMFAEIHASTSHVSTGAKQIADGSQALAQGSTQQAASIEELSNSIGEIAHKTKENADIAGRNATLADTIRGNAEKGSRQMDEMINAVKEINVSSQNIGKVIKVIDDIAFQTNILALNAAVEAARAGAHGKGFAVVAEEVRNLASKSADAAKDTGNMIQDSIGKAELGARIAEETAASLTEIVAGINESAQLINGIAKSSEEQSLGIMQINTGIDQVTQVVAQNSATAQESAAASQEMSSQSDMLQELISSFKLKETAYLPAP